ncbi:MAG: DNA polymerase III subunit delta [Chlorobia bacterium]|nr:DNA polymerase III subunit delta [Fimbriimonadaceae bacterium]
MPFSLEKAMAAKVVLLSGEEDALRLRAMQELMSAATLEDDFDLQVMSGGDNSPIEWSASVGTAPFLSTRRTVIVRHLLRCEEPDTSGWPSLPPSALLILIADEETGDESRQRKYGTVRGQWEKAVRAIGGYIEEFKSDPKQLVESIRQEAGRLGKKMSPKAAEALAEMCGGNLSRAMDELEKLAIFVATAEQISESDVREVAMPSREWNVFRMVDAALTGNGSEALRQLRILVGSATKAEEAAYRNILPTMSRQLRLIWQARMILDARLDPDDLPESFVSQLPENPAWQKQAPFVKGKAMRAARGATLDQLTDCLGLISDADAKLKGMLPSYSGMETLEQMLLLMIEALRPSTPARA